MSSMVIEGDSPLPWARRGVSSTRGAVAAAHPLAAQAGARILRQGGNAFDSAAATAAALNVVEPYSSGLAGMGAATFYSQRDGSVRCLDFVTKVPSRYPAADVAPLLDFSTGSTATTGAPGNLAGWFALNRDYGVLPFADVFEPAIELAEEGFPLTSLGSRTIIKSFDAMKDGPSELFDAWIGTFGDSSYPPRAGFVLRQGRLAETYRAIQSEGPGYLYGGRLGTEVVRAVRRYGGVVSVEDLEAVEPAYLDPIQTSYRDLRVATLPPPSEAFQFLLTLAILDHVDIEGMEHNGTDHFDTVVRAVRLAAMERIAHNQPNAVTLAALLDAGVEGAFTDRLLDGVPVEGPTEQFTLEGVASQVIDRIRSRPAQHTTSFSIADAEGNLICVTQSLGSVFGCGVVMEDFGVCLNNFLTWGERLPGSTNLLRSGGNLALPLAPSISLRSGRPVLAMGTPGSYGIAQTQSQVLVRSVDFGFNIQDAIEQPRARVKDGREVLVERRITSEVMDELRRRGHDVVVGSLWTRQCGGFHAVQVDDSGLTKTGGYDPRRDGLVATP